MPSPRTFEPEILLVDEVLAVGDAQFQNKCIGKMESVAQHGRTVLFVSHNMAAVRSLCTRGLLMRGGQMTAQGDVQMVIEQYFRDLGILGSGEAVDDHDGRSVFGRVKLNGGTSNSLDQSQPFELSTSFSLDQPISGFQLSCLFSDMRSQQLIGIVKTSEELGFDDGVPTGRHQLSLRFPSLWLNPGMYSVYFKMMVSGDASQFKHVSNTFPLDVFGTSSPVQAVLNPQADWTIGSGLATSELVEGMVHGE